MENMTEQKETIETGAVKKPVPASIKAAIWGIAVYALLSLAVMVMVIMQGEIKAASGGLGMIVWILIAVGLGKKSKVAWWGALIFGIMGIVGIGAAIFIGKNAVGLYQILLALAYWAPLIVVLVAINRKTAKEFTGI
jgi:hypothetical protein